MKKLNLPIIKGTAPKAKSLSMDDYVKFVTFNLKHTVNKRVARRWKKLLAVNKPFFIKE